MKSILCKRSLIAVSVATALTVAPLTTGSATAVYVGFTTVKLKVSNCRKCTVVVHAGPYGFAHPELKLVDGQGSFTVTRPSFKFSYELRSRKDHNPWTATALVTAYAGKAQGAKVSARQAKRGTAGYICSALPNQSEVTIKARVAYYTEYDRILKKKVRFARFWASPTLKASGERQELDKGGAYLNGTFSC